MRLALPPFLAAHLLFPVLWVVILAQYGPRPNDWRHFQIVGASFVAGDWTHIYSTGPEAINPGHVFRYPPFALYLVASLAWLTPAAAYGLLAVIEVAALAISMFMLHRLAPPRGMTAEWAMAIALSAPAFCTIVTGQSSALLMLCVVCAALLWMRGHAVAACAVLGLLAFKPNWGIFFGLYAIARREWGGVAAMVGVVAALCALTLPLGRDLWADFFQLAKLNDEVLAQYEPYKVITLKGLLDALLGTGRATSFIWGTTVVGLLAAAVWAWRTPAPPVRHLGITLLLAVAANPYASFYDALVLAVPATVWWSERATWPRRSWLIVGVLIAFAWCWEHSAYTWTEILRGVGVRWVPPFSVVGPVAALWLLLAARGGRDFSPAPQSRHPL